MREMADPRPLVVVGKGFSMLVDADTVVISSHRCSDETSESKPVESQDTPVFPSGAAQGNEPLVAAFPGKRDSLKYKL